MMLQRVCKRVRNLLRRHNPSQEPGTGCSRGPGTRLRYVAIVDAYLIFSLVPGFVRDPSGKKEENVRPFSRGDALGVAVGGFAAGIEPVEAIRYES